MGTVVFGKGIEPGGMELDNERYQGECPGCGHERARYHCWENADSGSINQYCSIDCPACGYSVSDGDE
ncbi:hypothetical protein [Janthinobacterium lividum]|uniref:hypothetical protein n=1 Tax=Janthinobacterium lividum TaxID=29581 RepID=UPI001595ED7E|nr:hypothetical protein [Janthinobacterium lividum]QKY12041.1 hypothetical protein G8765_29580 [Janthinobacterium lividum]